MKNFRLIIRIASLVFIGLTILIGLNGEEIAAEGMPPFWDRGYITFLENSLNWWVAGLVIMMIQLILDNIHINELRDEIQATSSEKRDLESQLNGEVKTEELVRRKNKFARIVIISYFIYMVVTIFVNIYLEELIGAGVYTFFRFIIIWGAIGVIVVSSRFIIDFNRIIVLKNQLRTFEDDVVQLKAQLYDKQKKENALETSPKSESSQADQSTTDEEK